MNDEMQSNKNTSHHIIGPSSTLLGFSFLVLTSIKSLGLSRYGVTDTVSATCVVLYAISTITTFVSIRTSDQQDGRLNYEKIADFIFLAALVLTTVLSILLALDLVKIGKY